MVHEMGDARPTDPAPTRGWELIKSILCTVHVYAGTARLCIPCWMQTNAPTIIVVLGQWRRGSVDRPGVLCTMGYWRSGQGVFRRQT